VNPQISIERVNPLASDEWRRISRDGFFGPTAPAWTIDLANLISNVADTDFYLARVEGIPAGVSNATLAAGSAFLGGMAVLEEFRGRGIQSALIARSMADASEKVDLAVYGASAGSTSHRNAERAGFRAVYTSLSLRMPAIA
jgi:GNAT superfamily N-acetyltransferase